MSYNIPILLIVYNRVDKTRQLLNIIEKIKPKKLFISADGPKQKNEDIIEDKGDDDYTGKKYNKDNPPPSLKVYEPEVTSLAPPIIRDKEIGPYDESLFEYQL